MTLNKKLKLKCNKKKSNKKSDFTYEEVNLVNGPSNGLLTARFTSSAQTCSAQES